MTYEEFMYLPFAKQVYETAKLYCKVNGIRVFVLHHMSSDFFKVRNYLMSTKNMIPRQNIKNIWKWLNDKGERCLIYEMEKKATDYVNRCVSEAEKKKIQMLNVKQHDVSDSLEDFLNGL